MRCKRTDYWSGELLRVRLAIGEIQHSPRHIAMLRRLQGRETTLVLNLTECNLSKCTCSIIQRVPPPGAPGPAKSIEHILAREQNGA